MNHPPIEIDYLVVGAGATAMSFVDTLFTESDARTVIVDHHHRPGGHWNHAYPFIGQKLHGAARICVCWRWRSLSLTQGLQQSRHAC
jgi:cation diffusion facilitator CzcD-associated flavoprotein CzcO